MTRLKTWTRIFNMDSKYGLYQTLSQKECSTKRITIKKKKELAANFLSVDSQTAWHIFMIIHEHASIHEDLKEEGELPYNIVLTETSLVIDVEKLPISLIHILIKFNEIVYNAG